MVPRLRYHAVYLWNTIPLYYAPRHQSKGVLDQSETSQRKNMFFDFHSCSRQQPQRERMNWTTSEIFPRQPSVQDVVGRVVMVPKYIYASICRTCEYAALHGKWEFADLIKLRILRWADYHVLSEWVQYNHKNSYQSQKRWWDHGSRDWSDVGHEKSNASNL